MAIRFLPQPEDGLGRVETGAIQFGDDWPGFFVRGDVALYLASCIQAVLAVIPDDATEAKLYGYSLASLASVIQQDVLLRPPTAPRNGAVDSDSARIKQVLVIRRDLCMRRGKEIAQGAHASMAFLTKAFADERSRGADPGSLRLKVGPEVWSWLAARHATVTLQAPDLETLLRVESEARARRIEAHVVTDLGLTEFAGRPTITALALGPDQADAIDAITGPEGAVPLALY